MDLAKKEHIEVLHITLVDLDNDTSPEHLAMVKKEAEKRGLDLELNISFDAPSDPRVNSTIEESLEIAMLWGQTRQIQHGYSSFPPFHTCMHVTGSHGTDEPRGYGVPKEHPYH